MFFVFLFVLFCFVFVFCSFRKSDDSAKKKDGLVCEYVIFVVVVAVVDVVVLKAKSHIDEL